MPEDWESTYPRLARLTPRSPDIATLAAAVKLAAAMLEPAMTADSIGQAWDATAVTWVHST